MDELVESLQHRGLAKEFSENKLALMKSQWLQLKEVAERKEIYKKNGKVSQNRLKKLQTLSKSTVDSSISEEIKELKSSLVTYKRKLKESSLSEFEFGLIPALLDLPNKLHPTTPLTEDLNLLTFSVPPAFDFTPQTHAQLGTKKKSIAFSDDTAGAFYLLDDLAETELALEEYFIEVFHKNGYMQHSNPDLVKGVTAEGCGYDIKNPTKTLKIVYDRSEDHAPLFLFGGCSLPSFTTYFAKRIVGKPSKFLPQKLFASGRLYKPYKSGPEMQSIFNSMQSSAVSAFVAFNKHSSCQTEIVKEFLDLLVPAYKDLGLHFKISKKCARNLERHESAAYSIEMVTTSNINGENSTVDGKNSTVDGGNSTIDGENSTVGGENSTVGGENSTVDGENKYIEIGRISIIGDFISRRLLMLHTNSSDNKEKSPSLDFLNVVYVKAIDISKFIAVLIENTQNREGEYAIPKAVKDIMLHYEWNFLQLELNKVLFAISYRE